LAEAKSRLVKAFIRPNHFPHSPSSNGRNGVNNLNFPFQPMSPPPSGEGASNTNPTCDDAMDVSRDLEILESQVTQLELAVNVILTDVDRNKSPLNKTDPTSLEGLDGLFSPPTKDKIPLSLYAELIALYDQELNGMGSGLCGGGMCDSGTGTNNPRNEEGSSSGDQCCRNRERNLRKDVLKWNKD